MIDGVKLSELIAVKLCHDLAGPVGAINNGADLLKDGSDNIFEQALDLVDASAKDAVARILYYRQAYGAASTQAETSISSLKTLADNIFISKNITINWLTEPSTAGVAQSVSGVDAKIILNLITIISNSLIYGGSISIKTAKKMIDIRGEGKAVKADMEVLGLLSEDQTNKITVKNVHAYLVSQILNDMKAKAVVTSGNDFIKIVVSY
jgi:histidine phosphotransferase ChpT